MVFYFIFYSELTCFCWFTILHESMFQNIAPIFVDSFYAIEGKWQQQFLSSHLKETPKLYIEVYYRIFGILGSLLRRGFENSSEFLSVFRSLRPQVAPSAIPRITKEN